MCKPQFMVLQVSRPRCKCSGVKLSRCHLCRLLAFLQKDSESRELSSHIRPGLPLPTLELEMQRRHPCPLQRRIKQFPARRTLLDPEQERTLHAQGMESGPGISKNATPSSQSSYIAWALDELYSSTFGLEVNTI